MADNNADNADNADNTARRAMLATWALVGWTILLWLSRTRNVLANDELTSLGRGVRLAVVVVFVAMAVAVIVGVKRRWFGIALRVLCSWTIGYWLVRGGGILLGDYDAGFKAVHTVLMVVSIGLAAVAMWMSQRFSRPVHEVAGLPPVRR